MMAFLRSLIGIGSVTYGDDSGELQLLQVTERAAGQGYADRVTDKVPRIAQFGHASMPPMGAEAVMIRRGGDRSQSIAIGTSHRASRPRGLNEGDSVLYDLRGRRVALTKDGIEVDGAGGPVIVRNASKVRCECDVETTGDVVARADGQRVSLNALHDAYAAHGHIGVKAGTDTSGATNKPA